VSFDIGNNFLHSSEITNGDIDNIKSKISDINTAKDGYDKASFCVMLKLIALNQNNIDIDFQYLDRKTKPP